MKKKTIPAKKLHAYIRAAIQVVFFICFPSAFTTAFSAIKNIFTQIGSQAPIVWSSFLTVCLALCAFTIVFGRFFCGYACAFGAMGDAVRSLYVFLCKKMQEEADYLETEKIATAFPEIRHFVGCRMSLLYRCIQRFKGLESVGCLFHSASGEYSSGRLLARYPLIRWHSCRHGTL